jgi:hypothetical protein
MLRNGRDPAMRFVDFSAALVVKGFTLQTQYPPDVHFEAMKDLTRFAWLLNFEAVATVPTKAAALAN